jgi:hypothetical protein
MTFEKESDASEAYKYVTYQFSGNAIKLSLLGVKAHRSSRGARELRRYRFSLHALTTYQL